MARRPFSLSAYLALGRSRSSRPLPAPPPRPRGPLVWLHAADATDARALAAIATRMRAQRSEITILATGACCETCVPAEDDEDVIAADLPAETAAETEAFAAHWRPEVGLWTGTALRPALLHKLHDSGTRLILLGASDAPWTTPAPGWMPDVAPATLALFHRAFTRNRAAQRQLRRLGLPDQRLIPAGPLTATEPPLECSDSLHEDMASALTGRPIWLAARLRGAEAEDIVRAHRRAVRLAHRLLLIISPADRAEAEAAERAAADSGLRLCRWEAGETPDETTQILLAEDSTDLGLWYRLSPIAFLGGSLVPGHGGENPMEAAAHGTALLYGPNVGRHLAAYSQLVEAGAARIVRDFDSLGTAVSQLVAPDQAAVMAHAGWDVVSQGAALADEVIELAFERIDAPDEAA
ncbi:3-deoxy-D-manno-octulosonic acid transferase [Salipiger mucosus]|uniref:3-deoxy-D-manno-octulosonic acid transferase n=1 Tax=Salipiger mucosus DSM 16094 TaxID=1123237 RepID=S9QJE5_9RHOB|nr:glycosyltransferase N-terminal domain-containing protein [Salipiger mucosus]EPX79698.1 3-deoxy-D-manno-octulosonic-acid transferase [Salipiger mucosus DSM 16094]